MKMGHLNMKAKTPGKMLCLSGIMHQYNHTVGSIQHNYDLKVNYCHIPLENYLILFP